jgi:hypothetical protein
MLVRSYRTLSPSQRRTKRLCNLLSVALAVSLRRLAVSQHHALWCADFPQLARQASNRDSPANPAYPL